MDQVHDVATDKSEAGGTQEQEQAAQLIQRNYRGYRERRQLDGIGLDASTRWAEVESSSIAWQYDLSTHDF